LRERLGGLAGVREVRGRGLMIGLELERACGELAAQALSFNSDHGLLINVTQETVVRLLPPLIMNATEGEMLTDNLATLVRAFLGQA
jgi:acetylornithine/N-succinyldiaminopimelate aminotransferase